MVNFADRVTQMSASEKRRTLTRRQQEIYDFLADKITNRGYGPTVREIGEEFNIKSPNGVMCHLKALERKGLIRRESNMSRAICLTDTTQNGSSLRLLGKASSGAPLQPARSSEDSVDFASMMTAEDAACIQIDGSQYSALGINHGDYVVISSEDSEQEGALVAALDDRHSLILARRDSVDNRLVPVLPGIHSSYPREVLGTITGVIRRFSVPEAKVEADTMIA